MKCSSINHHGLQRALMALVKGTEAQGPSPENQAVVRDRDRLVQECRIQAIAMGMDNVLTYLLAMALDRSSCQHKLVRLLEEGGEP